jgi:hypothetical protein
MPRSSASILARMSLTAGHVLAAADLIVTGVMRWAESATVTAR